MHACSTWSGVFLGINGWADATGSAGGAAVICADGASGNAVIGANGANGANGADEAGRCEDFTTNFSLSFLRSFSISA